MSIHLNESKGYWYLRRHSGNGSKETVAKLGQHDGGPTMWRPELINRKAETTIEALPEDTVDCIITDPPYGISFESSMTEYEDASELGGLMGDSLDAESLTSMLDVIASGFQRVLKDNAHIYVFTRWDRFESLRDPFKRHFDHNTVIVWDKNAHGMGDLEDWAPRHELIHHFEQGDPELYGKRPANVIRESGFTTGAGRRYQIHPTQKPRGLIEYLIKKSTEPGDVVLDPFGGAYTTARAAMRTFRRSVSCELDPETHQNAVSLTEKQLHDDPEYSVDWTEISNLTVNDTSVVKLERATA